MVDAAVLVNLACLLSKLAIILGVACVHPPVPLAVFTSGGLGWVLLFASGLGSPSTEEGLVGLRRKVQNIAWELICKLLSNFVKDAQARKAKVVHTARIVSSKVEQLVALASDLFLSESIVGLSVGNSDTHGVGESVEVEQSLSGFTRSGHIVEHSVSQQDGRSVQPRGVQVALDLSSSLLDGSSRAGSSSRGEAPHELHSLVEGDTSLDLLSDGDNHRLGLVTSASKAIEPDLDSSGRVLWVEVLPSDNVVVSAARDGTHILNESLDEAREQDPASLDVEDICGQVSSTSAQIRYPSHGSRSIDEKEQVNPVELWLDRRSGGEKSWWVGGVESRLVGWAWSGLLGWVVGGVLGGSFGWVFGGTWSWVLGWVLGGSIGCDRWEGGGRGGLLGGFVGRREGGRGLAKSFHSQSNEILSAGSLSSEDVVFQWLRNNGEGRLGHRRASSSGTTLDALLVRIVVGSLAGIRDTSEVVFTGSIAILVGDTNHHDTAIRQGLDSLSLLRNGLVGVFRGAETRPSELSVGVLPGSTIRDHESDRDGRGAAGGADKGLISELEGIGSWGAARAAQVLGSNIFYTREPSLDSIFVERNSHANLFRKGDQTSTGAFGASLDGAIDGLGAYAVS